MSQKFKTQKNLEQYLRRKKIDKPAKHAHFFLNIFLNINSDEKKDFVVSIKLEDIINAGLISKFDKFEDWQEKMLSSGILILNKMDKNSFQPSASILNYILKEKNEPQINLLLEGKLRLEIKILQDEISLLKEALKETNRRIERAAESWKLRSTFALKKENERQTLNTYQKRY